MTVFLYDYTFEGFLTSLFDAYSNKIFPDMLLREGSQLPLFYDTKITIATDETKAKRVWKALDKKLSATALSMISYCWMSQEDGVEDYLFRFVRKTIDSPISIETNFADPCSYLYPYLYSYPGFCPYSYPGSSSDPVVFSCS